MQIILFLILVSLLIAGGFLVSFFWAVKDGQYEDDFTPSMRILIDEDPYPNDIDWDIDENKTNHLKQEEHV